jgi:hypothetical protein
MTTLQIGSLQLRAPSTWSFHDLGMILGQRDGGRGTLQITLAFATAAPADAGHQACVEIVHRFMADPDSRMASAERVEQHDAIFGFITLQDATSFRRCWYRFKNGQLVIALYQCEAGDLSEVDTELREAGAVASSLELVANKP